MHRFNASRCAHIGARRSRSRRTGRHMMAPITELLDKLDKLHAAATPLRYIVPGIPVDTPLYDYKDEFGQSRTFSVTFGTGVKSEPKSDNNALGNALQDAYPALRDEIHRLEADLADHKEVLDDRRRLQRELDVAMN